MKRIIIAAILALPFGSTAHAGVTSPTIESALIGAKEAQDLAPDRFKLMQNFMVKNNLTEIPTWQEVQELLIDMRGGIKAELQREAMEKIHFKHVPSIGEIKALNSIEFNAKVAEYEKLAKVISTLYIQY